MDSFHDGRTLQQERLPAALERRIREVEEIGDLARWSDISAAEAARLVERLRAILGGR